MFTFQGSIIDGVDYEIFFFKVVGNVHMDHSKINHIF